MNLGWRINFFKKSLLLLFILSISLSCYADFKAITVYINDNIIEYDTQPININNRLLVPMRTTFETLDANVEWIDELQTVIATKNSKLIAIKIDSAIMISNDVETGECNIIELDIFPIISNNRILIPVRAVSEALDCGVVWNEEQNTIIIRT